jgi:hypothetical protein
VIFTWHFHEDVTAFVREIRAAGMGDAEDIQRELKDRYCLDVRAGTVEEILSETG